uniref:histidine kinase n=1 Tax=Candidatus Kentrum sp. FW TaxID=2126338 RepID=A0A450TM65_9GAMM|nr:MAG: GAF domain-containing protein [Candidatus Kentron sp. FW]
MISRPETSFQTVSELAHAITGQPVVIWLRDFRTEEVIARAQAGFEDDLTLVDTIVDRDDAGIIGQVMASGQEQVTPDAGLEPAFHGRDLSQLSSTPAMLAAPISSRGGETIGVIGFLTETADRLGQLDRETLGRITHMVAGQAEPSRRIFHLARATRRLIGARNLNDVAGILAQTAKELTGAYSSVVWLWNARTGEFVHASHAAGMAWSVKPRQDGLTRRIMKEDKPIRIDDATRDENIQKELLELKVRSEVGVPIRQEKGPIGVLFVNSDKAEHFTANDEQLLETLAGQFFAGFSWGQQLMGPMDEVEVAISRLFDLDGILNGLCREIQTELGFDYVAVQLIHPVERTIETVFGIGEKVDWVGVKHPMDAEGNLRDIQVDMARSHPRRIEVLHGWDPRLDGWIYDRFGHKDYVRAWVPMLLVRDQSGGISKDWWDGSHWRERPRESVSDNDRCFALELEGIEDFPRNYPLGTVDAGYTNPQKTITSDDAKKLADLVSHGALAVRKAQLPGVLETIAEGARRILNADAASLHFAYNPEREGGLFAYEVTAGKGRLRFYHHNDPGHHGLWRQAMREKRPRFMPDESREETDRAVEFFAPNLYRQGIRAVAAFPFIVGDHESVLYIYFETPYRFTEEELHWVESFVRRAERAVLDATRVLRTRDQARQLANLHEIARSLVTNPESPNLLQDIAGYVASILGADVVTIYEYFADEKRFAEPVVVGRLLDKEKVSVCPMSEDAIQFRVIDESGPIYAETVREKAIFHRFHQDDFIDREKIRSAIAYPLTVHEETVGVMFVNYRTFHRFTEDDKGVLVPTLAASAAMAIQVARSHRQAERNSARRDRRDEALQKVERAIADKNVNLQQVLDVILQEAMNITGAAFGYFLRYRWQGILELVAQKGLPEEKRNLSQTLETGIIGRAARTLMPQFAPDVTVPEWKEIYHEIVPEARAEMAVPLVDENGLWGVLNVESPKPNAFDKDDLAVLERFARQAMISIHETTLRSNLERQAKPLHFLNAISSRIQDPRHDSDTVLRLLLTGVTSSAGLRFSRAMLFLMDEEGKLKGRMAIGSRSQEEASEIWKHFAMKEDDLKENSLDPLDFFLDEAERFSEKIKMGEEKDSQLSLAVQGIPSISVDDQTSGALTECIKEGNSVVVEDRKPDAFRTLLKNNNVSVVHDSTFACIPLVGEGRKTLGALVVDYQFLNHDWVIDAIVRRNLEIYAGVIAMAIENTRLRDSMEKQREAAWKYFSRQTAHSIGNRIAQIEGPIFWLQDAYEDHAESASLLENLEAGVEETKALLRRFRDVIRPSEPKLSQMDLGRLLASVAEENRDRLQMEGVELSIRMPVQTITLMGDKHLLSDVFAELMKNAREAMALESIDNPLITIRVDNPGDSGNSHVRIDVVNPGRGVPGKLKRRIFEPFHHGHGKGESRGLGLAIIKESIEAHKGTIEETGVPGRNACFSIRLPVVLN